jgi:hypothetical protein
MRRTVFLIALMAMLIPGILEGQKELQEGEALWESSLPRTRSVTWAPQLRALLSE